MLKISAICTNSLFLFCLLVQTSTASSSPEFFNKNDVTISHAVIHKPYSGAKSASGYLVFKNSQEKTITLLGVTLPIGNTMIHQTTTEKNGVVKMEHLTRLDIPADTTVSFKPGGLHIMIIGLNRSLTVGEKIPAKIKLTNAAGENFIIKIGFEVITKITHKNSNEKSKHKH